MTVVVPHADRAQQQLLIQLMLHSISTMSTIKARFVTESAARSLFAHFERKRALQWKSMSRDLWALNVFHLSPIKPAESQVNHDSNTNYRPLSWLGCDVRHAWVVRDMQGCSRHIRHFAKYHCVHRPTLGLLWSSLGPTFPRYRDNHTHRKSITVSVVPMLWRKFRQIPHGVVSCKP